MGVRWHQENLLRFASKETVVLMHAIGADLQSQMVALISVKAKTRTNARGRKVAIDKATPGAPPRVVSSHLHGKIEFTVEGRHLIRRKIRTRAGTNVIYARKLHWQGHEFMPQALQATKKKFSQITRATANRRGGRRR